MNQNQCTGTISIKLTALIGKKIENLVALFKYLTLHKLKNEKIKGKAAPAPKQHTMKAVNGLEWST
jgi:hypothetical protein